MPPRAWRLARPAGRPPSPASRRSGVAVLSTMTSISPGVARARAAWRCAPRRPRSEQVDSPAPAMRRSRMPVRSTIHSCDVSSPNAAKSWFVTTFAGSARPVPARYDERPLHAADPALPFAVAEPAADVLAHARSRRSCAASLIAFLMRARRGLAVRDDADAAHAEQRCAAVLRVVEMLERRLELLGIERRRASAACRSIIGAMAS